MAESEAIIGYKTIIRVENARGSGVMTKIGEVTNAEAPSSTSDDVEVTHMESPDGTKEFIPGLKEYAELNLDLNWVPGSDSDNFILAWEALRENRKVEFAYPNGVVDTFPAYVRGYTGAIPVSDRMTAQLTLKVAGARVRS